MLRIYRGDIFESSADAIVNPVNCVGAMGAGLALEFKKRYPEMYKVYWKDCSKGRITIGSLSMWTPQEGESGKHKVVNFPTKDHWRNPSKMEWIEDGLSTFGLSFGNMGIASVAFPLLGSGLGGLPEHEILPRMVMAFIRLDGISVDIVLNPIFTAQ